MSNQLWNNNSEELIFFLRGLIIKIVPWKTECRDGIYVKLDAMIDSNDPYLNNLFNIYYNRNC